MASLWMGNTGGENTGATKMLHGHDTDNVTFAQLCLRVSCIAAGSALPSAKSMASQTQRRKHSRWVEAAEAAAREAKQVINSNYIIFIVLYSCAPSFILQQNC